MRRIILTLTFLPVLSLHQALAQLDSTWSKIDTLTRGPYDDVNPVIVHNAIRSVPGAERLIVVFERHTTEVSQIASVTFDPVSGQWDSVVSTISTVPVPQEQIQPDFAELDWYITGSSGQHMVRLATWLRKASNLWQIYYSTLLDSQAIWSTPTLLVEDTVDNTSVKVRPFRDSLFVFTWKRANTLQALLLSPSGIATRVDSLVRAASDVLEYDVANFWDRLELVWTSGSVDDPALVHQGISLYQNMSFPPPETLLTDKPVSDPRTYIGWNYPNVLVESRTSGSTDIFGFTWYGTYVSLTDDPAAENRNASAFTFPAITKSGLASPRQQSLGFQACAYEKYRETDSMLVFLGYGEGDTVRSTGHNWNPVVGSREFQLGGWPAVIPIVWESNRTGRSHIYGRWVRLYFDDVEEKPLIPTSFQLEQNFPNPFNPSTTIRYGLPWRSTVTLTIFNTLGQQVTTLVNGEVEAGYHEVMFNADGLASGVYFYRLQVGPRAASGGFVSTKKLCILK